MGAPNVRRVGWIGSEFWLLALVLFGYGYFDNGHNWNHISRFDAIFSFVEPDSADPLSFRIDHFLADPKRGLNTGDWARNPSHGEHYYSNKAPGPILLGVPVYAALYSAEALLSATPESRHWTRVNTWLLNLLLTVVPAAFGAILFRRLLCTRLRLHAYPATLLTGVLCFCTAMFPYATQFWGHVSAASFGVISLYFLCLRTRAGDIWSGFFVSLAVLSDYGSAITLLSFALLLATGRRGAASIRFALGGLPGLCAFGAYHVSAFGSWFAPATLFNNPRFGAPGEAFGFQFDALFGLSASAEHGLFWFMPVLLLAIPGAFLARSREGGELRNLALVNAAGFAAMNLFFLGWHGGACLGPRYLIPSLPFWVLLLAPLTGLLRVRGPLAAIGASIALVATGVSGANMALLALRSPSLSRAESGSSREPSLTGPLGRAYTALLAGELAPPELSPIRLGGTWLADGVVTPARQGFVGSKRTAQLGSATSASSRLHLNRAGRVRLVIGWQGTLSLTVAGVHRELGHHKVFSTREIVVALRAGDTGLEVRHVPDASDPGEFRLLALAPNGSVLLPRPTPSSPLESVAGSNLGRRLGLDIVASTIVFGVGFALLVCGLVLSVRRESASTRTA